MVAVLDVAEAVAEALVILVHLEVVGLIVNLEKAVAAVGFKNRKDLLQKWTMSLSSLALGLSK